MILVLTSNGDLTADYVLHALESSGASPIRLNTDDLLSDWRFQITPSAMLFESDKRLIRPADISAVYYRRAFAPEPTPDTKAEARRFVVRESRVVLRALYSALNCYWISNPASIEGAENKPRQLTLAKTMGFNVPESLITNRPELAKSFWDEHQKVIIKAISYGDLTDGRVLHTSIVDSWDPAFAKEISLAPIMFQRYVQKRCEYRVTVVKHRVFCCRIESQVDARYAVDMRKGLADDAMAHQLVSLPSTLESLCVDLVARLGLQFGAIDLVEDVNGAIWFLEINPNGQWAWIEDRVKAPISHALAEALING